MMNPGSARPEDDITFNRLENSEFSTGKPVTTISDETMEQVERLIKLAYEHNNKILPKQYTIHIENLFNLREEDGDKAKKLVREIRDCDKLMFRNRESDYKYQFVWLAWGKIKVRKQEQTNIINKFPNAIMVKKINYKGEIKEIDYPKHPLYMNSDFFLEASKGKIL
jgi:hypothetical protein